MQENETICNRTPGGQQVRCGNMAQCVWEAQECSAEHCQRHKKAALNRVTSAEKLSGCKSDRCLRCMGRLSRVHGSVQSVYCKCKKVQQVSGSCGNSLESVEMCQSVPECHKAGNVIDGGKCWKTIKHKISRVSWMLGTSVVAKRPPWTPIQNGKHIPCEVIDTAHQGNSQCLQANESDTNRFSAAFDWLYKMLRDTRTAMGLSLFYPPQLQHLLPSQSIHFFLHHSPHLLHHQPGPIPGLFS